MRRKAWKFISLSFLILLIHLNINSMFFENNYVIVNEEFNGPFGAITPPLDVNLTAGDAANHTIANEEFNGSFVAVTHSPSFELTAGDATNHTISWNLTLDYDKPHDYDGAYSFTEDAIGGDPSGWTVIEGSGCTLDVISGLDTHLQIVRIVDQGRDQASMEDEFPGRLNGSIEFWWRTSNRARRTRIQLEELQAIMIYCGTEPTGYFAYYGNSGWQNVFRPHNDQWYHIRIDWNSSGWQLTVNGVLYGANCSYEFHKNAILTEGIDALLFFSHPYDMNYKIYFDAIDYSWAPGYFPFRNNILNDYLGTDSFTGNAVGGDPNGWTVAEGSGCTLDVIKGIDGHQYVTRIDDQGGGLAYMFDEFPGRLNGSVEFWWRTTNRAKHMRIQLRESKTDIIYCGTVSGHFAYQGISGWQNIFLPNDFQWHLTKIEWNSSGWQVSIDHTLYGAGYSYGFYCNRSMTNGIDELYLRSVGSHKYYAIYFDAIDYSWTPGYFPNRNMFPNGTNSDLRFAIFENDTRKTDWHQWIGYTTADYNISGLNLMAGIHNISLVFDDVDGRWNHSDIIITVNPNNNMPNLNSGSVLHHSVNDPHFNFNFTVIYVDQDNNPPSYVNLVINGTRYLMQKQNLSDNYYLDGCIYQFSTYLHSGVYFYFFECSDNLFYNLTNNEKLVYHPGFTVTHSSNLDLFVNDSTNFTTTWNMNQLEMNDYLGTYSFTGDAIGGAPSGWTVGEGSGCTLDVIKGIDGHQYVTRIDDQGGGSAYMFNKFPGRLNGSVEFWWRTTNRAKDMRIQLQESNTDIIYCGTESEHFAYYGNSRWVNIFRPNDFQWHLIKIEWNRTGWQASIDHTLYGAGYSYEFYRNRTMTNGIDELYIRTVGSHKDYAIYFDAIDYSWAPGYFPNRNMQIITNEMVYAIFEDGTQKMKWQNYHGQLQINHNISGFDLGVGVHNISLVFNNSINQWYHDDVIVTVHSTINPPMLAPILPNPDSDGLITLRWSELIRTPTYCIYRDTSPITSVDGLAPIAAVTTNYHQDMVTINGIYYYAIEAKYSSGNISISNYQNVTVAIIPPSNPPILFAPNPDHLGNVKLNWTDVVDATTYYIYRKISPISSVDGMRPLAVVTTSDYQDSMVGNGTYYYVIVAGNVAGNSTISNCKKVLVPSPFFNGLYLTCSFRISYAGCFYSHGSARFSYSYVNDNTFSVKWNNFWDETYRVDTNTRIISGSNMFGDGVHTPVWIFREITIGDVVPIAIHNKSGNGGDHLFNVTSEGFYYDSTFGPISFWILRDLTNSEAFAWYEKSTGFLLKGNFIEESCPTPYTFHLYQSNFNLISPPNDHKPTLSSGTFLPENGTQTTLFNFSVIYQDWDCYPPTFVNLIINGSSYNMEKQDPSDLNYKDGCIYKTSIYLQPGNYDYSFNCSDGLYFNSTPLSTGLKVIKNNITPILNPILPNPDYDGIIELNWSDVVGATSYYIYRSTSPITSVEGMIPIATVFESSFQDGFYKSSGMHFYVTVAATPVWNSSISNCVNVTVVRPAAPLWYNHTVDGNIRALAMSSDGEYIVVGVPDPPPGCGDPIYLFQRGIPRPIWVFEPSEDTVSSVAISADGSYIAAAAGGSVYLFFRESPTPLWTYEVGEVLAVSISDDGFYIAVGTNDAIFMFNRTSSTPIWSKSQSRINSVVFSPNGYVAISFYGGHICAGFGCADAYGIKLYDPFGNKVWSSELRVGSDEEVRVLAISANGSHIVCFIDQNYGYNTILLFENPSSTARWDYYPFYGNVNSISISADGSYFALGTSDHKVYLFNNSHSTPIWQYVTGGAINSVAISKNGLYAIAGSTDNNIYLFHQAKSKPIGCFCTSNDVNHVGISAEGSILVAVSGSTVFAFNITNDSSPELTMSSVDPENGDQSTQFNFSVIYTDSEGIPPKYINLLINGTPHSMEKQNSSDMNYTDGCMYQYLSYLEPGTYIYSFECNDGFLTNWTENFKLVVNYTNNYYPSLNFGSVIPPSFVSQSVEYNFTVIYVDQDNNPPEYVNVLINGTPHPMEKQNSSDTYYPDGCMFQYLSYLKPGTYIYSFECSDGLLYKKTRDEIIRNLGFICNYSSYLELEINDLSNYTLTWDLNNLEVIDHLGEYSFTIDTDGTIPLGWVATEPEGTKIEVIPSRGKHRKVVEITNSPDSQAHITNCFSSQPTTGGSSYEFYIRSDYDAMHGSQQTFSSGHLHSWLHFSWEVGEIRTITNLGASSQLIYNELKTGMWYHIRVEYNTRCSIKVWVNNSYCGVFCVYRYRTGSMAAYSYFNSIRFSTSSWGYGSFSVDAIDFSWAPGYYPNRNMDFEISYNLADAVFANGVQKTSWHTWIHHLQVDYNISVSQLGVGEHNISLVFNNSINQWFNYDVIVVVDPLEPPILEYILPNPNEDGIVLLNWSEVKGASTYYIYRSRSPITSIYKMVPIANVSVTHYQDTLSNGGNWYYAIVGWDSSRRSTISNCESVIVAIPPSIPTLASISPNPDGDGVIQLNWSDSICATSYYIFRADSPITSTVGLTPLARVSGSTYRDTIRTNGIYHYAIVANHVGANSSLSNCVSVQVYHPNGFSPGLFSDSVTPPSGHPPLKHNFSVWYCDLYNLSPIFVNVVINGTPFAMKKQDSFDTNYIDGCLYHYLTDLPLGINIYSFSCYNHRSYNSTIEKMIFNPGFTLTQSPNLELELEDPNNHTITWNLQQIGTYDYSGEYSFTEDPDGSDPANWTIMREPSNTYVDVVAEKDGHRKVLELWDDSISGHPRIYNTFSSQTSGSIEFWLRYTKGTENYFSMLSKDGAGWGVVHLSISKTGADELSYYDGAEHKICDLSENTWHHVRITFEHTTGGHDGLRQYHFNVYVNGTKYGEFPFQSQRGQTKEFHFFTDSLHAHGDFHAWVDAVDYSWAPGYYPNRNRDYSLSGLTYAIFENGTQKTNWHQWKGRVQVSYNVSGLNLGVGVHNISLVFNNALNQWFHNDITVIVGSLLSPPVIEPILPNPDNDGIIVLNWSEVEGASTYCIYRSRSPITSIYKLMPIANVSVTHYQDTLSNGGNWYYTIIAGNSSGRSAMSNCESVIVTIPPSAPTLASLSPNPDGDGIIELHWSDSMYATSYYIFRANSPITSTVGLTPLARVSGSTYRDTIRTNEIYHYAIVASHVGANSSLSNCVSVQVYHPNGFIPGLFSGSVTPPSVHSSLKHNFSVWYCDPDNLPPIFVSVVINGTSIPMEKRDLSDTNYIDGCFYQYLTDLPPRINIYSFKCYNGRSYNSTIEKMIYNPSFTLTHSPNLELGLEDADNHTITWNLQQTGIYDNSLFYSFTEDPDGSDPANWTIMSEPSNTHVDVVAENGGHRKVLELWDDSISGYSRVYNTFSSQTSGSIEFWLRYTKGTENYFSMLSKDGAGWGVVPLSISKTGADELSYYYGADHKICDLSENTWHHVRITFEHTTGGYDGLNQYYFNIYVNGTKYGEFPFQSHRSQTKEFHFHTYSTHTHGDFHAWVDAVDYSWVPGYYPNRNMDFISFDLTYAIFENETQKSNWQQWKGQVQVDYNVSGLDLGIGVHNISLVFNNAINQWFHDDITVIVKSPLNSPVLASILPNPSIDGLITLNWSEVEGASTYRIYRSCFPITSEYQLVPIANVSVSHYQDTLSNGGCWYYAIVAENSSGRSAMSNCESVIVTIPPSAPTLASILPNPDGDGIIQLNWSDSVYATSYYIFRANAPITSTTGLPPLARVSGSEYQDIIGINGIYYYAIVASHMGGNSSVSNCESVTVGIPPSTPTLDPIVPYINVDGLIELNWSEVIGAITYYLFRGTNSLFSEMSLIAEVSQSIHTDSISINGYYYYVVMASNPWGNSSVSNCECVSVAIPPAAPTLDNISPNIDGDGIIELAWNEVDNALIYHIYRDTSPINSVEGLSPITTVPWNYSQDNIGNSSTYYYVVVAAYMNSNSSLSNCENVTIDLVTPNIINVTQDPTTIDRLEPINVSVRIQENVALALVQLESNHTGSLSNYTMDFLSGSLQDGFWNYTITTWPANNTIRYRIFAIDVVGRTVVTKFHHFGIFPTIEWSVPLDLDFKISLGDVKDCTIAFNFENTGTTTLLNLNFTIDLPLGWSAEINSVSINRLAPQESASLLFRITAPDSADKFLEVMSIDFEATVLETGETYGDAITIVVAGKSRNNFIIWLIILVGSVSSVASTNFVVFRRWRKKRRIHALLYMAINEPKMSHAEVTESAVGEGTDSTEIFENNHVLSPPFIASEHLLNVLNVIIESFPSLARQFPTEEDVKFLMEEVNFSYKEFLPYLSSLLARVSASELRTQICVRMNALRSSQDNGNMTHVLQKIDELLYWAESANDHHLLNNILQLILFIQCS